MAKFTVTMSVAHHVEADDEVEALRAAKETLPTADGVFVQNVQVMPGHQPQR